MKINNNIDDIVKEMNMLMTGTGESHGYEIYYTTLHQNNTKHRRFLNYDEVKAWCKKNKNKVKLRAGSNRVFEFMKSLRKRSTQDIINDNSFGLIERYNTGDIRRTRDGNFFVDGCSIAFKKIEDSRCWINIVIETGIGRFETGEYVSNNTGKEVYYEATQE